MRRRKNYEYDSDDEEDRPSYMKKKPKKQMPNFNFKQMGNINMLDMVNEHGCIIFSFLL